jgi:poly(A) polymerase
MKTVEQNARYIIECLFDEGHVAFYAGGWVRDFLMGTPSDDIDIATSAKPEEIQELFPKTIAVGAAFGVIVVVVEDHQFEVATFRSDDCYVDGRKPESVTFSTPRKDVARRDFTINGMYYDPIYERVHDFIDGQKDLKKKLIRAIGDADARFEEDRLRMIRAVRFSTRFGFSLEEETKNAIEKHAPTLKPSVSVERIWQECVKMIKYDTFGDAIVMLYDLGLLVEIFPMLRGMPREQVERFADVLRKTSSELPAVYHMAQIFPGTTKEEMAEICSELKLSKKDCRRVEKLVDMRDMLSDVDDVEMVAWARIYAYEESPLCLHALAAREHEGEAFLEEHRRRHDELEKYISRIRDKDPLITSQHLVDSGVVPGKKMGALLQEAERLAVNIGCEDADEVLVMLKKTSLWNEEEV